MMQESIKNYIQSDLKFSSSKLYFQHQNQLLQKIGFISPMTIDIYYKYTFQQIQPEYFIEGGEFQGITVDHSIHEQGIIYKIGFLHPKYQNVENLSLDLKMNFIERVSIWPLIREFLGGCIVFALLFWLYNIFKLGQILFWLNVVGVSILFLFYACKIIAFVYKKSKAKKMDYGGLKVSYSSQTDVLMLTNEMVELLKKLSNEFWIVKFCYTGNCVYLLQDILDRKGERLISTSKLYSEQEKANLQQKTLEFIHQSEFLSHFSLF